MAAPQQESRQGEEHRDRQVEAAEQSAVESAGVPGVERHVGDDDADRSAGPHPFDCGQESASAAHLPAGVGAPLPRIAALCIVAGGAKPPLPRIAALCIVAGGAKPPLLPIAALCIVAGGEVHTDSVPGLFGYPRFAYPRDINSELK